MAVASTRLLLQWPPGPSYENTDTLVLVSNNDHFVDIRILKTKSLTKDSPIDWILTGKEYSIPNTNKIEFQHEINTNVPGCFGGDYDSGEFRDLGQDREEIGEMMNPETKKVQPYREVWRSIDPLKSTPDEYVREGPEGSKGVPCVVLKVKTEGYFGSVVRLGNFLQGAILNKSNGKYSAKRYYLGPEKKWSPVLDYGDDIDTIPVDIKVGEKSIKLGNIEWELVESNL